MTAGSKAVLYSTLVAFSVAGAVLEEAFGVELAKHLWRIGAGLIPFVVAWLELIVPASSKKRDTRREECQKAWDRLRKEDSNLQQALDAQKTGKEFSGLHKTTVEIYAFRNTAEDIEDLEKYWRYWRVVRNLTSEIKAILTSGKPAAEMQLDKFIQLRDRLSEKLRREVKT